MKLYSAFILTIITSVYNGDAFISHFLNQIEKQTIYDQCQHIIVNAASPGNEDPIIRDFARKHPNVEYIHLDKDPGLYAVWNMAINRAKAPLLTNANLDDRLSKTAYEELSTALQANPKIDLIYSNAQLTHFKNQQFGSAPLTLATTIPDHTHEKLKRGCYMGSHPMWRKSMHTKYGLFDQRFRCTGDWEMWLRASSRGATFHHYDFVTAVNYTGSVCLSSRKDLSEQRDYEHQILKQLYNIP